jgi:hypothetical protein
MTEDASYKLKYHVELVEKTTSPDGLPGDNWHRYVIAQGSSKIEGKRPGSLKAVTEHVEEFTRDLNSRCGSGVYSYARRKKT